MYKNSAKHILLQKSYYLYDKNIVTIINGNKIKICMYACMYLCIQ